MREALNDTLKKEVRRRILEDGVRPDGRDYTDIRPLAAEVDVVPRVHGSGLFKRGQTQVLSICTLGTPRDSQPLDGLYPEDTKRYMHHYNFPPFSTGETWMLRGPKRREIGHGALAENALRADDPAGRRIPLHHPRRQRSDVVQRQHQHGERLRQHPVADGGGRADHAARSRVSRWA